MCKCVNNLEDNLCKTNSGIFKTQTYDKRSMIELLRKIVNNFSLLFLQKASSYIFDWLLSTLF